MVSNDDWEDISRRVEFEAAEGVTYHIAIDAYGGYLDPSEMVTARLHWEPVAVPGPLTAQIPSALVQPQNADSALQSPHAQAATSSTGEPNKGDTFVSESDGTIVLFAPKAGVDVFACPVSFTVQHSIVTYDTPRERDLHGQLKLTVKSGDPTVVSMSGLQIGESIAVTEPGHVGGGVHDWHRGTETFQVTGLKSGEVTLDAEVDPDPETEEGDGQPRTKATIKIKVIEVEKVEIYGPDVVTDQQWLNPKRELKWNKILNKGEPLKIKVTLSDAVPADENPDVCSLRLALYKYDETPDVVDWIDISHAERRYSPDRTQIWVTVDPSTIESGLQRFNDSESEYASAEDPGSSSFEDGEVFDSNALQLSEAKFLVPGRGDGNETNEPFARPPHTIPPFTANTVAKYVDYGGAVYMQVEMMGERSKRRLCRNQADILYISGHGSSNNGAVGPSSPTSVEWKDDLDIVIIAGCSVLDINDYNGRYDDDGDGVRERGPRSKYSNGEMWAKTGPKKFLGYNYKAPLDAQGTAGVISRYFSLRDSEGDVAAWMKANDYQFGKNACAIDMDWPTPCYFYYHEIGPRKLETHELTLIPQNEW